MSAAITAEIRKELRSATAKKFQWPGIPFAQYPVTAHAALKQAEAAGAIKLIERPKANPQYTATFVCLADREPNTAKAERVTKI